MMSDIETVGQLRQALAEYSDDMPVWLGETADEGGLSY